MRAFALTGILIAALASGCDPGGLRRVQLQLPQIRSESGGITVDSPDTKEALQILDAVLARHGYQRAGDKSEPNQHRYLSLYSLNVTPISPDEDNHPRTFSCKVNATATGIQVTFGESGLFAGDPKAFDDAFKDVTTTFIKRFGRRSVKSHKF